MRLSRDDGFDRYSVMGDRGQGGLTGLARMIYNSPERVGGISANLVDFVEWRFVVWRGS